MERAEEHNAAVDISLNKHASQIGGNYKVIEENRTLAKEQSDIIQERIEELMNSAAESDAKKR